MFVVPWKNSWFQIAFFAWTVSGTLLIVDYAPKVAVTSEWAKAFHREPRPPSEAPATPSSPSEQPALGKVPALPIEDKSVPKGPTPARSTPIQSPEKLVTKASSVPATVAGSSELAQGQAASDQKDYAQAMQWYQKSAAQGNADAQNNIGHLYRDGLGVQKRLL